MRSVLLPTLLNGKDHSRQEHVLSSNGIEKIQWHRILPSHRPPGEEGAIATIDWICSRPSPLREKSMPPEWPSSHEIQHGEAMKHWVLERWGDVVLWHRAARQGEAWTLVCSCSTLDGRGARSSDGA